MRRSAIAADVEHAPVVSLPSALLGSGPQATAGPAALSGLGLSAQTEVACTPQAVEHARHLRELAEASSEPTSMTSPACDTQLLSAVPTADGASS